MRTAIHQLETPNIFDQNKRAEFIGGKDRKIYYTVQEQNSIP